MNAGKDSATATKLTLDAFKFINITRVVDYTYKWHWNCSLCGSQSTRRHHLLTTLVDEYEHHLRHQHRLEKEDEPF